MRSLYNNPLLLSVFTGLLFLHIPPSAYPQNIPSGITKTSSEKISTSKECNVYVASPYGFAASTMAFKNNYFNKAIEMGIKESGCKIKDPWVRSLPESPTEEERKEFGLLNSKDIDESEGLVAGLDGPDVDSGTAAEIGYAAGRGKWIVGYRSDLRRTGEGGGGVVNLQVEYFILYAGQRRTGKIVSTLRALCEELERITHGKLSGSCETVRDP